MPSDFNIDLTRIAWREPRVIMRILLGLLVTANLAAALVALRPWGGSVEDLARQRAQLDSQLRAGKTRLQRTRLIAEKLETARKQDDDFAAKYIMDRRTTFSNMMSELNRVAKEAGVKEGERSVVLEAVDGSDTLIQMTITAAFQGTYPNLTRLVNLLDRSKHFLIIENMVATPQQSTNLVNVTFKVDTFVRDLSGDLT